MKGFYFSKFVPSEGGKSDFDRLLDVFMQLLSYTNGDAEEALRLIVGVGLTSTLSVDVVKQPKAVALVSVYIVLLAGLTVAVAVLNPPGIQV